jgi:hypothetical protein
MPKSRTSQTYNVKLPPLPSGLPGPVAEQVDAVQTAVQDLVNQLNRHATAPVAAAAGGGTPAGLPVFANGRFWTDPNGIVWLQFKDNQTGLYHTPYFVNGVWVTGQEADS